jgi:hypothetical protein
MFDKYQVGFPDIFSIARKFEILLNVIQKSFIFILIF